MTTYDVSLHDTVTALETFRSFLLDNHEHLEDFKFDLGFAIYNVTADELRTLASLPGGWIKSGGESLFCLERRMGSVTFEAIAPRAAVCTARSTGRKVTLQVPHTTYQEREVDEVEWVCEPVLGERAAV